MFRARSSVLLFLFLFGFLHAEENGWVLAAEKFDAIRIPSVYKNIDTVFPELILSRILAISKRSILSDEKKGRELASLSSARMKLVKDRSSLVLIRDKVLLEAENPLTRRKDGQEAEKNIAAKEKEITALDVKIQKITDSSLDGTSTENITLWESGKKLYTRTEGVSLEKSLTDSKISALISGSVEDIAGYLNVTVSLVTGIRDFPVITVSEAGPYDELDNLVATVTARLLPGLSMVPPVRLTLDVDPAGAVIFIDKNRIDDLSVPVTLFSGEHTVAVSADGYESASRTYSFAGNGAFRVSITLKKESTVSVAFDTKGVPLSVFLHTKYLGETPVVVKIPAIPSIGETLADDNRTFFILDPAVAANDSVLSASIKPNKVRTQTRIEKQRTFFYYSLAALYFSLPVSMLTYGICTDKYNAYESGKLAATQENADEVNSWTRAAMISRYVSIGLGVNVAVQLFRYILAAEQAIPKKADITVQKSGEN